jgi:hypothetical protein
MIQEIYVVNNAAIQGTYHGVEEEENRIGDTGGDAGCT